MCAVHDRAPRSRKAVLLPLSRTLSRCVSRLGGESLCSSLSPPMYGDIYTPSSPNLSHHLGTPARIVRETERVCTYNYKPYGITRESVYVYGHLRVCGIFNSN